MAMVLRQAAAMLMAGLAVGLLLSYVTSRVVGTLLYGVKAHDPRTMVVVTLVLLVGGLAAAFIPARRAAAVDR
jgi:ABC-type antimicrobial peptide transport system permease subunit